MCSNLIKSVFGGGGGDTAAAKKNAVTQQLGLTAQSDAVVKKDNGTDIGTTSLSADTKDDKKRVGLPGLSL